MASFSISSIFFVLSVLFISGNNAVHAIEDGRNEVKFIPLIGFGDKAETTNAEYDMVVVDDPVMGGVSQSEITIVSHTKTMDDKDVNFSYLQWTGVVLDVSFLSAPGFCSVETKISDAHFNDASEATEIVLKVRSQTPQYQGFKLSFSSSLTEKPIFASFKADFFLADTTDWQMITMPFNTFSSKWSAFSGEQLLACSPRNNEVCPTANDLANLLQITVSAEGVSAPFQLDIGSVFAMSPSTKKSFLKKNTKKTPVFSQK